MSSLGFIGLGDMGSRMARRLIGAGHHLVIWNRSIDKAVEFKQLGASVAGSAAEVLQRCELTSLCLSSHDAVIEVARGMHGLFSAATGTERRVVVDCSTGAPEITRDLWQQAASLGIGWVDAPVSGGPGAALAGTLTMFLGGDAADISNAAPLLDSLSAHRNHLGPAGAGHTAKLCNQLIVAANILAIGEALAIARQAQVDVKRFPEVLKGGYADSLPLQLFGPRMAAHEFTPRLGAISLMEKDVRLVQSLGESHKVPTPIASLCADLYATAQRCTNVTADSDISSIIRLFESPR
jgi:3-hydroxyisobutyrate dehydrogenase